MFFELLPRWCVTAALLLVVGCQDEGTVVTHVLRWHQEAGSEIQTCHVFKLDNDAPVEVDRIRVQFATGSHHVHIYRSDTPVPDDVSECWNGIDWTRWHLVLGAQTQPLDWQLPEGRTVPLEAHQQLLVQVHWLDTTAQPIDGEIDLEFHTTASSDAHVGVVFGIDKQVAMQPHERKVLRQWCAMPDGAHLLALMGHYHGLGTHYTIDTRPEGAADGTLVYEAQGEQTFQFETFDPPRAVPRGDGLSFSCEFFNYRDIPITWSADTKTGEHCNMVAYYEPAEELSQFCLVDALEVSSLTGPQARVALGTLATYTLQLSDAAPAESAVIQLAASDPSALEVPASVVVAAGQRSATFTARALRPSRVTVSATLGTTAKTASTTIGGLSLSEVYVAYRPWIEIANLSDETIDLSRYSLGAGGSDYTTSRTSLSVVLPPKGCAVVDAPTGLVAAPTDAFGIGLFDRSADQITKDSLPYDTLVYGHDNNTLLDPFGHLAQVVGLAPASGTYVRTSEQWSTQTVPTPGICEVQ